MTTHIRRNNFIERARLIHGDRYDYSNVVYEDYRQKVDILCKIHGVFKQTPDAHLSQKQNCPKCAHISRIISKSDTADIFINKARLVHGDYYDYSKTDYNNSHTYVHIICRTHGIFQQTPNAHLNGQGCPDCGKIKAKGNTGKFIDKARSVHGNRYDYSKAEYTHSNARLKIICPIHGVFNQVARLHTGGKGCPDCGKIKRLDKTKPAMFYYLRLSTPFGMLYKIGVTSSSIKKRYSWDRFKRYELIYSKVFQLGKDALKYESYLKRQFVDYLYSGPPIFSATGNREIFSRDILNLDH